jgi:hypothetical protein
MSDLLTSSQKQEYSNVFNDIHDTFARPIKYWKTPRRIVISSSPNYNFIYDDQDSIEYITVPDSGSFEGRILWGDPSKTMDNANIKEEILGNTCRVKLKKEFVDIFEGAEQVEIDGRLVQKIGSSRPHGLFDVNFYTLFFKETN